MIPLISIIIIAGNEEKMISECLKSCKFADEVIVSTNCNDKTIDISLKTLPSVIINRVNIPLDNFDFSLGRNLGFKKARGKWILYVDSDERVTPELKDEILDIVKNKTIKYTNYDIPRQNFFLNHRVYFGGTYPDYVKRLFIRKKFKGYNNKIHEQPIIVGKSSVLKNHLLHFTHRDINSMLNKSINWTLVEAEIINKHLHPPIVWWRILRMVFSKLWERLIKQQMWRDNTVGFISAIFESFDTYMIYSQLWEIQLSNKKHA